MKCLLCARKFLREKAALRVLSTQMQGPPPPDSARDESSIKTVCAVGCSHGAVFTDAVHAMPRFCL